MLGQSRTMVAFLVILLWLTQGNAQEKSKIFVGASSKTLGYSPLWVATKKGFFDQQGLDVQLVLLRGVPMTLQALAAGSLHFGSGGPEPYIEASERGLDFVVTGGIINGMAQFLIAARSYKTYEDLRGATFGTSSLSGGIITALKEALKLNGLEYPRDYKLLVIAGGSSANLAALQSGQIAATTVAVPLNYAAEEAGLNIIRRHSVFSNQCARDATIVGRDESAVGNSVHESNALDVSLDVPEPRCSGRLSLQRDAAQSDARAQRLGVLHREPVLATGRRRNHGGNLKQHSHLCGAERCEGAAAEPR
jgi:NMT1/THI5 like protein